MTNKQTQETNETPKPDSVGLVSEIAKHLGSIYRHMLPGMLLVGGARLAYRDWFHWVNLESWKHLLLLAVTSVVVGNAWFALNRYGLHQALDYVFYRLNLKGPVPHDVRKPHDYTDDLGKFVYDSLIQNTSQSARQHVEFRASTVLLILTVGEVLLTFGLLHDSQSILTREGLWGWRYGTWMVIAGPISLAIGGWQMVITRRIDFYRVKGKDG
jgi:hypothetical protein